MTLNRVSKVRITDNIFQKSLFLQRHTNRRFAIIVIWYNGLVWWLSMFVSFHVVMLDMAELVLGWATVCRFELCLHHLRI